MREPTGELMSQAVRLMSLPIRHWYYRLFTVELAHNWPNRENKNAIQAPAFSTNKVDRLKSDFRSVFVGTVNVFL